MSTHTANTETGFLALVLLLVLTACGGGGGGGGGNSGGATSSAGWIVASRSDAGQVAVNLYHADEPNVVYQTIPGAILRDPEVKSIAGARIGVVYGIPGATDARKFGFFQSAQ